MFQLLIINSVLRLFKKDYDGLEDQTTETQPPKAEKAKVE